MNTPAAAFSSLDRFDPWQAVALLEDLRRELDLERAVEFSVTPGMAFPVNTVNALQWDDGERWQDLRELRELWECGDGSAVKGLRVVLPWFGMLGQGGPLPYNALAARRSRRGDRALADFLDIFQNSLLRVHAESVRDLSPEYAPAIAPTRQALADYAYALAGVFSFGLRGIPVSVAKGLETGMLRPVSPRRSFVLSDPLGAALSSPTPLVSAEDWARATLPDAFFLARAPVWSQRERSAAGLEILVESLFGVAAKVESFAGAWEPLPEEYRTRLGTKRVRQNTVLGENALLGRRVWDACAGIVLRLTLDPEQRRDFLPPPAGRLRAELMAAVRWYTGDCVRCSLCFSPGGEEKGI